MISVALWRTLKISFWNFWEKKERNSNSSVTYTTVSYRYYVSSGSSWIKDINIHLYKGLYSREIVVNDWFREADRIF